MHYYSEYLRSRILTEATEFVNSDGTGSGFDFLDMQRSIFKIFITERTQVSDSNKVIEEITRVAEAGYDAVVNQLNASRAQEVINTVHPVHPKQIYPHGYLCECGNFQETVHPIPCLFSNGARTMFYQEEIKCSNCQHDIVVPLAIVEVLKQMLDAAVDSYPAPPPSTFYIYRPPLDTLQVPPHLVEVLKFDDYDGVEEDEEYTPPNITSMYKELVNSWTRESLSHDLPYLCQLFNSKTFSFNFEQEWKDWSATLIHYLEDNGVFTITPWSVARYHYTKQPHMTISETHTFLTRNFHWLAGIKLVKSVISFPDFLPEFQEILREIFMFRCFTKIKNWHNGDLEKLMTKDSFSLGTVISAKSAEKKSQCSRGRLIQQDKKMLPSVKVFEDYDTLVAVLENKPVPPVDNNFTPMRENFHKFSDLLMKNAPKLFATGMTDLYIVRRTEILKYLHDSNLLYESLTPSFENYQNLQFDEKQDYILLTYLRLSENLPEHLLEQRHNGTMSDILNTVYEDDGLLEEIEVINPDWRESL